MKKKIWVPLVLIGLCLIVFFGYRLAVAGSKDTAAPQIQMDSEQPRLSVTASEEELLQGVTATDNKDGDVTASLLVESIRLQGTDGTATVRYAAFDKAGNVAKADRQVYFTDYESPRFSLSAPMAMQQNSSKDVMSIITASDLLDGDISRRIRATTVSEEPVSGVGVHQVEFRVSNSLGDTVRLVLPLEVYPAGSYSATLTLTDYLIYLPAGAKFSPEAYLDTFFWRNEELSLQEGLPEYLLLEIDGTVDTRTPGVYSLGYTVRFATEGETYQGGQSYAGHSRLTVVVEG